MLVLALTASGLIALRPNPIIGGIGGGIILVAGIVGLYALKGQKYFPEEDHMPWPARQFSLVGRVDGRVWVGLFSTGEALSPSRTIGMAECTDEFVWSEREDVLDGEPEAVAKGITKSGQQVSGGNGG